MNQSVQNSATTGRPLEFDPEKTRDAMMRLFWEKGFAAVSLPDLEKRTGLSRSSLYNSFGSKQEIFDQSLDRYRKGVVERMCRPLESGEEGLADLIRFFDAVAEQFTSRTHATGCLMVNSMVEFAGSDTAVVRHSSGHMDRLRRAFAATLERAAGRGEISRDSIETRVGLVVGLLLGITVAARAGLKRTEISAMVDSARVQIREWSAAAAQPGR